jgi:hypothetical protein
MAWRELAFDQRNASSLSGERDGSGTAGHSATEDENFILQGIAPESRMFGRCVAGFLIKKMLASCLKQNPTIGSRASRTSARAHESPTGVRSAEANSIVYLVLETGKFFVGTSEIIFHGPATAIRKAEV